MENALQWFIDNLFGTLVKPLTGDTEFRRRALAARYTHYQVKSFFRGEKYIRYGNSAPIRKW